MKLTFIYFRFKPIKAKYSIENFLDEVQNKLSFNSKQRFNEKNKKMLNTSLDGDYEFYDSDEESSDEEMNENMKRLVDKERDDGLGDSGYSEEGCLKNATMLDHSYSKSINSLIRPHTKRESKGVAALLHLANAASKELQHLSKQNSPNKDGNNGAPSNKDFHSNASSASSESLESISNSKNCSVEQTSDLTCAGSS